MAYDIFISYRRAGGYETAKHLYDLLSRDGYSVSFDIDTLRNGDFDVELLKRVEECTDFVLILNQGAFDRTIDPNFDPKKDWLRQELAHALKLGKNVIPIMLNGFTEFPDNLPADVARVQKKNGPKYDQYYFDGFYNKLIDVFFETPKPVRQAAQATSVLRVVTGTLIIKTDLDCRVLNYGEEVGVAKAGEYTTFELPLGDNELKYVGLESDEDCYEEPAPIVINENSRTSVKVALLDKYNARKANEEKDRKAKEEAALKAELDRMEAEKQAKVKAERDKYLLSLPDEEFELFWENHIYGYKLRISGEIAIPLKYDNARDFSEGLARVKLNGKYGFIDKAGNEIIPFKYDSARVFTEGLAAVQLNSKWGYINKMGIDVIPISLNYNQVDCFFEGRACVTSNGKRGYIDKTGEVIIPLKYHNANSFSEGLACVELNGKYGFIDKTGKEIIPLKYDWAGYFYDGLAWVSVGESENGKFGFIDKTGKEVIALKYDRASSFSKGKAKVKLNGEWFYIDKNGNRVE